MKHNICLARIMQEHQDLRLKNFIVQGTGDVRLNRISVEEIIARYRQP